MDKSKLNQIRQKIKNHDLYAYLVPTTDEFQSEYPPEATKRLEYITGFSSSNAMTIITLDDVLFFTDSRYIEAAQEYLSNKASVFNINILKDFDYLKYFPENAKVGYNPKLFSKNLISLFNKLSLVETKDLIDEIWVDKPSLSHEDVFEYDIEYSGITRVQKLEKLKEYLKKLGAEAIILNSPESICWLLNFRSADSQYSPIMISYLYVDFEKIILFTTNRKIPELIDVEIEVKSLEQFDEFISSLNVKILVPENSNEYICKRLQSYALFHEDPTLLMRSIKDRVEIIGAKKVHIEDAVALIEFFAWFYENGIGKTESEIANILSCFRSKQKNYKLDSFAPIVGFGANSSKIHYKPEKYNDKVLEGEGILLLDSGGHYLGGTTDVTRTIVIGAPKEEWRYYYTMVLKGHIALASIIFPKNVKGANIDVLARMNLWKTGKDYGHGTGHGVGNFLSVHEGPASINLSSFKHCLVEGMIFSNEPGYYEEKKFGIRIENLQFIKKSSYSDFLEFEQLTLVPYCSALIDINLLTASEMGFIKDYYKKIEDNILPHLSKKAAKYLSGELNIAKSL